MPKAKRRFKERKTFMKKSIKTITALFVLAFACSCVFAGGKKDKASQKDKNTEAETVVEQDAAEPDTVAEPVLSAGPEKSEADLRIGILNGPTSIPAAYLCDDTSRIAGAVASFEKFATPAALLPKMIKGEIDIGFMPVNVAAKAYNSSNGAVLLAGVSGNGNIMLITRDADIASFADLKGKKVSVAGQGSTPDYMFRYLLAKNNIAVGEGTEAVELIFSTATANIVPELLSGKIAYAVVPEPFSTIAAMKDSSVRRAIDFQSEFEKASGSAAGSSYPLTAIVVTKEYASKNIEKIHAFLNALNSSIAWTIANPQKAGVLVQKNTLGLMAPIVGNAIPNCNFVFESAAAARPGVESLLSIFLELDAASVGGKLPDDGFYFN